MTPNGMIKNEKKPLAFARGFLYWDFKVNAYYFLKASKLFFKTLAMSVARVLTSFLNILSLFFNKQ